MKFEITDPGLRRPLVVWLFDRVVGEISRGQAGWRLHYTTGSSYLDEAETLELRRVVDERIAILNITERLLK